MMLEQLSERWGSSLRRVVFHLSEAERAEYYALPREVREQIAFRTKTRVNYSREESSALIAEANAALLRAAPNGYKVEQLNGINVGAGSRWISPHITPVDVTRRHFNPHKNPKSRSCLLSGATPLPFRDSSLDFIISSHSLEHIANPIPVVRYWIRLLKPGGGIGIILPDYRYTWDARHDRSKWGHKWNPCPELLRLVYERFWSDGTVLEEIDTLSFRMAFNLVIRKAGEFRPFDMDAEIVEGLSGHALAQAGKMIDSETIGSFLDIGEDLRPSPL